MSAYLYFSNNSISNTTLTCDQIGIQYVTTTSNGVLSLSRWDSSVNAYVIVKQWAQSSFFGQDLVRIKQGGQWIKAKYWLSKGSGGIFSECVSLPTFMRLAMFVLISEAVLVPSCLQLAMVCNTGGKRGPWY